MAGTEPRKSLPQRLASGQLRGANVGATSAGVRKVRRGVDSQSADTLDEWVVVEPEADIAAKGHAYISFDPAGVYTP